MGLDEGQGEGSKGGATETPEATPPVSEEIAWRTRALQAERELEEAREQVAALEAQLADAESRQVSTARSHEVERALRDAGAIDLETAQLLVEAAMGDEEAPDIEELVGHLRRDKAFLFTKRSAGGPVMSALSEGGSATSLDRALERARKTGDRKALLRYLRMRRGVM